MTRTIAFAALLLSAATPALAHHSGAMFDRAKTIALQGTVKNYLFANPHSWIDLMVKEPDGKVTQWSIEAQTPAYMRGLGVTPSVLKAGDLVTIRTHPLRDGRTGGSFVDVTMADGRVLGGQKDTNFGAPPAPAAK
jgi:hypothetical protein